jgi:site-specific DNA-cytosine methylase
VQLHSSPGLLVGPSNDNPRFSRLLGKTTRLILITKMSCTINSVVEYSYGTDLDLSTSPKDIAKPCRQCSTHNYSCPVPQIVGAIGGISCKDFCRNRLTGARCETDTVYLSAASPGRSADCMHGFTDLLETNPPDWFLLENSDELANNPQHTESLNLFCADIGSRSYDVRVFTADADDFILPEKRRRTYIVGIQRPLKCWKVSSYTLFFDNMQKLIKAFMLPAVRLADALYPDNHSSVEKELDVRQSRAPCNGLNSNQLNEQRLAWGAFGLRSLPGLTRVPADDLQSPWFRAMTLRKRSSFEILQHRAKARTNAEEKKLNALEPDSPLAGEAQANGKRKSITRHLGNVSI